MNNLRLLKIKDGSLCQSLESLSDELRLLNWHGFQHNNLFELNMCYSPIKELWKGVKHLNQLKIIILSHSTYLTKTPDFTGAPNLERLILDGCTSLSLVHPSVGRLKKLILLNLKDCKQLRSLRAKIEWESLEVLILTGCSKLDKLPEDLWHLVSLKSLYLGGTAISQLPSSIVLLKNLKQLSFHGCKGEPQKSWSSLSSLFPFFSRANPESMGLMLPSSLSALCSLRQLNLGDCNLQEGAIPSDVGFLPSLIELKLSRNNFVSLPPSISQLPKLETLFIEYCDQLQALPELPASTDRLYAQDCTSLEIISSSPSSTFKPDSRKFYLNNCLKLAGSRRSNGVTFTFFNNVLQSLLKSQDQGHKCGDRYREIEIVVPGSHVPHWFIYQSEGSSIRISQPMPTCRGLALCAAFSVDDPGCKVMTLECNVQVNIILAHPVSKTPRDTSWNLHFPIFFGQKTLGGTDHLWWFYISTSYLTEKDSFNVSVVYTGSSMKVKKCGLRPVHDFSIEEFIEASNNLSSNTSPQVSDPDRLAVISTVIKRSRDYCRDQQPYPKRLK